MYIDIFMKKCKINPLKYSFKYYLKTVATPADSVDRLKYINTYLVIRTCKEEQKCVLSSVTCLPSPTVTVNTGDSVSALGFCAGVRVSGQDIFIWVLLASQDKMYLFINAWYCEMDGVLPKSGVHHSRQL